MAVIYLWPEGKQMVMVVADKRLNQASLSRPPVLGGHEALRANPWCDCPHCCSAVTKTAEQPAEGLIWDQLLYLPRLAAL